MIRPKLTSSILSRLKMTFATNWMDKLSRDGGVTEVWWRTVLDVLIMSKCDLVPHDIRIAEEQVIRRGLAKEYLASLLGNYEELKDEERLLVLTLATAEERLKALNIIVQANPEADITLPRYLRIVKPGYIVESFD